MYEQAFYLTGKKGNNAFAYEARGEAPRLYVPAVLEGTLEDVQVGRELTFSDFDENGNLLQCRGLKHFVKTKWNGIPVVIVDNHNHVFYFWYEALKRGEIERGATLIHVDAHKDARKPEQPFKGGGLEKVFHYTNEILNVGNYIIPAQEEGLLGEVEYVTGEGVMDEGRYFTTSNKILNLDLDFFCSEFEYIPFEKTKAFLLKHAVHAQLITVATSPFFIDQHLAIQRLIEIFGAARLE